MIFFIIFLAILNILLIIGVIWDIIHPDKSGKVPPWAGPWAC